MMILGILWLLFVLLNLALLMARFFFCDYEMDMVDLITSLLLGPLFTVILIAEISKRKGGK